MPIFSCLSIRTITEGENSQLMRVGFLENLSFLTMFFTNLLGIFCTSLRDGVKTLNLLSTISPPLHTGMLVTNFYQTIRAMLSVSTHYSILYRTVQFIFISYFLASVHSSPVSIFSNFFASTPK